MLRMSRSRALMQVRLSDAVRPAVFTHVPPNVVFLITPPERLILYGVQSGAVATDQRGA
jgi:hypothetical protein